ncbi:hypothetical protein RHGRI_005535 [Rhododendron griersonianum]|nr:hypothetical protein RHGRI_005535 [Rhododendron griersonianum]
MESVRGVNVPMYTTLRRTTVVFAMVVEAVLAGQKYTSSVVGRLWLKDFFLNLTSKDSHRTSRQGDISVALIVLGAFIAGARDLSFDSYGYAVVFLANITTAIYLATIARIGKSSGLNSFGLMWCNGIICGPFLLFWTFIRGDLELTLNFPYLFSPGFLSASPVLKRRLLVRRSYSKKLEFELSSCKAKHSSSQSDLTKFSKTISKSDKDLHVALDLLEQCKKKSAYYDIVKGALDAARASLMD